MSVAIERSYVRVGERHVHVRRGGRGPAVLLLHQSPQSSRALLPWMNALAPHYHVIAPDTPGFGESDPLPRQQPELADHAAHLDLLLQALDVERAMVWGMHTGASIGCALALDFPDRVALLVCDGLPLFDADEQSALLSRYLPPFEPSWDGSHLTWLWARLREQTLFWPWFDQRAEARMACDQAPPERLHDNVLDVLQAGDGYRSGYRAPFLPDDPEAPGRLRVPAHLLYRREDVLAPHLARLPTLPAGVVAEAIDGIATMRARSEALFAQFAPAASTVAGRAPPAAPVARGHPQRRLHSGPEGSLAYRWVQRSPHARLVLHDLARAPSWSPGRHARAADDSVLAPDLPGHGGSAEATDAALGVETMARQLHALIDTLPIMSLEVHAWGLSAACAVDLCGRLGERVRALHLHQPLPLDAAQQAALLRLLPDLRLTRSGAHLQEAWTWARQRDLFLPWMEPVAAAARAVAAPAPLQVHADTCALLQLGERLPAMMASAVGSDWPMRLASLPCTVHLHRAPDHPLEPAVRALETSQPAIRKALSP